MSPVEVTRYHRLLSFPNPSHGHCHGCHSITGANEAVAGGGLWRLNVGKQLVLITNVYFRPSPPMLLLLYCIMTSI